jgi:alpha-L-fucosidase 2
VYDNILKYEDDKESIPFCSKLKAVPVSGDITVYGGSSLRIIGTDFMLVFSLKTGFNGYDKQPISQGKEYQQSCFECLSKACSLSYDELLGRHEKEYGKYFNRVSFTLEGTDFDEPTDERIKKAAEGRVDNNLVTLLFDYSRFLLICSNGIGTQPANLQGIWNEELLPLWRCNYTININTQMNYWTVNACDLPEMHIPLLNMLRDLKNKGNHFGLNGWAPFHNTDIWRDNSVKSYNPAGGWWVTGGAWLCRHIWEHYLHTRDIKFLEESYDILVSQADFLREYMTEANGELIISPSVSPENSFMFNGKKCVTAKWTAADQEICIDFFDKLIKATEILGKNASSYKSILEKIKPVSIGTDGRIQEWNEEFEEEDPGHRHISHLYGFYPADVLTDEKYTEAVKKSVAARVFSGDDVHATYNQKLFSCGHIGWSCAWIGCVNARLLDGEGVMEQIRKFFGRCAYDNMLGVCTIFQIESNFGIAAAIIEALVQSHGDKVIITPAIPKEWEHGEVKGLVVRTGEKINFKW